MEGTLDRLLAEHGLTEEEYERIKTLIGREPNRVELGMFSVLWSEHCSYKSSKALLKLFPTTSDRVIQGPGENAGIVRVAPDVAIVMKIESHNHPSAIEPYQGAATGVGGIVRDIFTMGARPIASLNSLRFGPLTEPHNRYLLSGVVAGIAGYGNCLGLPTVAGEVAFDECYRENPLVNAMCVGVVRLAHPIGESASALFLPRIGPRVIRARAEGAGNTLLYVGSSTGRDGIHGATFASGELTAESEERRPAVQIGDPFTEKLLIEACLELAASPAIVGMQDMGAAGLTSSSAEMASRAGTGVEIDLDQVPLREEGMTPYEIMLSESQERMLVVVHKGQEEEALRIVKKWGLHAVPIGQVTEDGKIRIRHRGEVCAEIPARALVDEAPTYFRRTTVPANLAEIQKLDVPAAWEEGRDWNEDFLAVLGSPTIASKRFVFEQYDHMVQLGTLLLPGSGDAAILRIPESDVEIAVTTDGSGRYCFLDPFEGGRIAIAEASRNLAAVGAEAVALTNCLNFGNPEKPDIFYQFEQVVRGIADAAKALQVPVVSGNVSFYNESEGQAIYPTPVVGMLGVLSRTDRSAAPIGMGFKKEGALIILMGETLPEIGGSEWLKVTQGMVRGEPPELDIERELAVQKSCIEAIREGMVKSAHDLSEGGLAVALAECLLGASPGAQGAAVSLLEEIASLYLLFSESQSRILVTVDPEQVFAFESVSRRFGAPFTIIGKVEKNNLVIKKGSKTLVQLTTQALRQVYEGSLPRWMAGAAT